MISELGRNSVGAYAAAKGDLKIFTKYMATEWANSTLKQMVLVNLPMKIK